MNILINVATAMKGITLFNEQQNVESIFWDQSGQELKWILPSLHLLLKKHGVRLETDVKKIILVIGPGSFTGIRIAVSVVNTLKYLYPHIVLATLSTGELFSAIDRASHHSYFFQVFASDIFEFDQRGEYRGRFTLEDTAVHDIETGAGYVMDTIVEKYSSFTPVPSMKDWTYDELCLIEKKATCIADLAEPFYGKGANITIPRSLPSQG